MEDNYLVPPINSSWLKSAEIENDKEYIFQFLNYEKESGGKFPDIEGFSHIYTLFTTDGQEKKWQNNSKPFRYALGIAKIKKGDWVKLKKTGDKLNTRYQITRIDVPEGMANTWEELENIK